LVKTHEKWPAINPRFVAVNRADPLRQ